MHRQKDLHEAGMVADTVDLARRHLRLLARHEDRGAQARFLVQPLGDMPVIDGAGERGGGVRVMNALQAVRVVQNRVVEHARDRAIAPA